VAGEGEKTGTRAVLYCLVPRDLAEKLHDPLRDHFRDDPAVHVVVERRTGDRRVRGTRRGRRAAAPGGERRRVRSVTGRRVAERRALSVGAAAAPALPRNVRRYAERLVFVERLEPADEGVRDADSKRIVIRHQAGDETAFGDLYLRYFNPVYTYARVALSDHHEAEDVTQQVFIKTLSALDRYELRPGVPFRGWLFSIARNVVITAITKRSGVILDTPDQLESLKEQGGGTPSVSEALGWLTDSEVAMFVERLPLAQRQVLTLRFMLDLTSEEVAQVLGRSHTAVRKLQSRALDTLSRRLAAVGRTSSSRSGPIPVRRRIRPIPVVVRRKFALMP
jgi:RNA polymerase sigma-70 factor (ECF subfamily)